ncbi:MAG: sigma-54 dependent transcriptional regulator [Acidobacteriota bacterium]|jgi:DNA-binding NtrC family response regulator
MTASEKRKAPVRILVVDDEPIVVDSLAEWFRQDGYDVDVARNAKEALRRVAERRHDIAVIDIRMPGMDGLELQRRLADANPDLTVIVMTGYASVESAVQALKAGAYDYITKPFDPDELSHLIRRASEHRSLRSENLRLKESLATMAEPPSIVGDSPGIRRILELVETVAPTDATVLVRGESGCGKELVARAIHAHSPRRFEPLVTVNCGALAEGVLESELFGHEPGSFTGAQGRRKGKFELADGGTIFLDEIGAVAPKVQVEMLRVLEEKTVTRVGGQEAIAVDFRVVAATNQDLEAMVREGTFRDDLYWRLNVFTIPIPSLRERPEDIPLLTQHFLDRYAQAMNRKPMRLCDEALEVLCRYQWPGNVRELQNAMERAMVVGQPPEIRVADLPVRITGAPMEQGARSLAAVERRHIIEVLDSTDWNISQAARVLEVDRSTLYNKLRDYDLKRPTGAGVA